MRNMLNPRILGALLFLVMLGGTMAPSTSIAMMAPDTEAKAFLMQLRGAGLADAQSYTEILSIVKSEMAASSHVPEEIERFAALLEVMIAMEDIAPALEAGDIEAAMGALTAAKILAESGLGPDADRLVPGFEEAFLAFADLESTKKVRLQEAESTMERVADRQTSSLSPIGKGAEISVRADEKVATALETVDANREVVVAAYGLDAESALAQIQTSLEDALSALEDARVAAESVLADATTVLNAANAATASLSNLTTARPANSSASPEDNATATVTDTVEGLNVTTGPYESPKVWTSQNDGAGSGLDADRLDNMSSEDFLAHIQEVADNLTEARAELNNVQLAEANAHAELREAIANESSARANAAQESLNLLAAERAARESEVEQLSATLAGEAAARASGDDALDARIDALLSGQGDAAWNAVLARDGAGTGLDADKLDGLESSAFAKRDGAESYTGKRTFLDGAVVRESLTVHDGLTVMSGLEDRAPAPGGIWTQNIAHSGGAFNGTFRLAVVSIVDGVESQPNVLTRTLSPGVAIIVNGFTPANTYRVYYAPEGNSPTAYDGARWFRSQYSLQFSSPSSFPETVSTVGGGPAAFSDRTLDVRGGVIATRFEGDGSSVRNVDAATVGGIEPSEFVRDAPGELAFSNRLYANGGLNVGTEGIQFPDGGHLTSGILFGEVDGNGGQVYRDTRYDVQRIAMTDEGLFDLIVTMYGGDVVALMSGLPEPVRDIIWGLGEVIEEVLKVIETIVTWIMKFLVAWIDEIVLAVNGSYCSFTVGSCDPYDPEDMIIKYATKPNAKLPTVKAGGVLPAQSGLSGFVADVFQKSLEEDEERQLGDAPGLFVIRRQGAVTGTWAFASASLPGVDATVLPPNMFRSRGILAADGLPIGENDFVVMITRGFAGIPIPSAVGFSFMTTIMAAPYVSEFTGYEVKGNTVSAFYTDPNGDVSAKVNGGAFQAMTPAGGNRQSLVVPGGIFDGDTVAFQATDQGGSLADTGQYTVDVPFQLEVTSTARQGSGNNAYLTVYAESGHRISTLQVERQATGSLTNLARQAGWDSNGRQAFGHTVPFNHGDIMRMVAVSASTGELVESGWFVVLRDKDGVGVEPVVTSPAQFLDIDYTKLGGTGRVDVSLDAVYGVTDLKLRIPGEPAVAMVKGAGGETWSINRALTNNSLIYFEATTIVADIHESAVYRIEIHAAEAWAFETFSPILVNLDWHWEPYNCWDGGCYWNYFLRTFVESPRFPVDTVRAMDITLYDDYPDYRSYYVLQKDLDGSFVWAHPNGKYNLYEGDKFAILVESGDLEWELIYKIVGGQMVRQ